MLGEDEADVTSSAEDRVSAVMCSWRIYGIHDDYLGTRPPGVADWEHTLHDSPEAGDQTTFHLGGLPEQFVFATRYARASLPVMMGLGDWKDADDRLEARDRFIEERADGVDLRDLSHGFNTWLSIEIRRPVNLTDRTGTRFLWIDATELQRLADPFRDEVADRFDYLTSVALSALGDLRLDQAIAHPSRPVVLADGKGPVAWPEFTAGAVTVSVGRSWDALPLGDLTAAVAAIPMANARDVVLIQSAARWLTAALREGEDALRRFLFAFFGLEVLAGKFARLHARTLIEHLETALDGLPVEELVWPKERDNDFPDRNLTFRFAVMASTLSPTSAAADVVRFKALSRQRNQLAHGGDVELRELPAVHCIELLQRYVGLVAAATARLDVR